MKPYQYSFLKYPDECLFQHRATERLNPFGDVQRDLESYIHRDMQQALADFIAHSRVEKQDHEFYREYRLRLYVFTEDQFYEMVNNEVNRQLDIHRLNTLKVTE